MSVFASQIETDTILFKRYFIILEFNIFKVTVETKTLCAVEKFESDLYFSSELFCFSRNILLNPFQLLFILF